MSAQRKTSVRPSHRRTATDAPEPSAPPSEEDEVLSGDEGDRSAVERLLLPAPPFFFCRPTLCRPPAACADFRDPPLLPPPAPASSAGHAVLATSSAPSPLRPGMAGYWVAGRYVSGRRYLDDRLGWWDHLKWPSIVKLTMKTVSTACANQAAAYLNDEIEAEKLRNDLLDDFKITEEMADLLAAESSAVR
mmetsp:Transcript_40834/g.95799  ORF Transcript_40834/g.95799 Transcript_40834/m.95799 type:complete len:191 (-) Transcript_40834:707-1279(-)